MEHILAVTKQRLGVCSMTIQRKETWVACPVTSVSVRTEAKAAFDDLLTFSQGSEATLWQFEKQLLVRVAVLGACLIRLFLTARHERLDVRPFLDEDRYRSGDPYAERTLKTAYGEVTYGRHNL